MALFLLCGKVFLARILDVSLGTIRTVVTVKGKSKLAAGIAFVEVFIWFVISMEALTSDQKSLWVAVSYAAGFATGTFVGSTLSKKLIKGVVGVQVITNKVSKEMIEAIRNNGFAVSVINLYTYDDVQQNRKMLFIQVTNRKQQALIKIIKDFDDHAFIVVNETKYVQNGFIK
jgi:Uncharacterized protein conserved in bacteria